MISKTSYKMKPPPSVRLKRGHALAKGLVGCWPLNERSGAKVFDSSGNRNGGIVYGASWDIGTYRGLRFDAAGEKVVIARNNALEPQRLTIVAGVKILSTEKYHVIMDKSAPTHVDPYYSYYFRFGEERLISGGVVPAAWADRNSVEVVTSLVVGNSYCVAMTFDGTILTLYKDGVAIGSNSKSVKIAYHATDLRIGSYSNITSDTSLLIYYEYFYNRALQASEIARLYREAFFMFERRARPELCIAANKRHDLHREHHD